MPKVPFTAFYNGPTAVYPIQTAEQDVRTGAAYLGTDFLEGNYADVSNEDAQQWNNQYGTQLRGGRYRICRLALNAIAANLPTTAGNGGVVGWANGTFVGSVVIGNAGSGYTAGTYTCVSSYNIGSQSPCVITVTVGTAGTIISASVVNGGGPFLATPTFGLTELTGGSSASITAQLHQSSSYVSSFDSTASSTTSLVKGITYAAPTAAQITAGAWIIVQESGIAEVYVTTATSTTKGAQAVVASGGAVTTQTFAATSINLEVGYALTAPVAATNIPTKLTIPVVED
jgi:hypothetical protein